MFKMTCEFYVIRVDCFVFSKTFIHRQLEGSFYVLYQMVIHVTIVVYFNGEQQTIYPNATTHHV
jgi:hypothetical protein